MNEGLKQKIWNILTSWRKEWLGTSLSVNEDASLLDLQDRFLGLLDEETKQIHAKLDKTLANEEKIVRTVCHNVLQQPMYGKKLQDTVIFHLRNFKKNIEKEVLEAEK